MDEDHRDERPRSLGLAQMSRQGAESAEEAARAELEKALKTGRPDHTALARLGPDVYRRLMKLLIAAARLPQPAGASKPRPGAVAGASGKAPGVTNMPPPKSRGRERARLKSTAPAPAAGKPRQAGLPRTDKNWRRAQCERPDFLTQALRTSFRIAALLTGCGIALVYALHF